MPLAKPALHLADVPDDWLDIRVFPAESGSFRLYEDDGVTPGYLNGEFQWTSFAFALTGSEEGVLRIDPARGYYPALSANRGYSVTLVSVDMPERVVDDTSARQLWQRGKLSSRATYPFGYTGLPAEYSGGVLQGVLDAPERDQLGGGILTFACAVHHPVDSSTQAFRRLAKIVVRLLQLDAQTLAHAELTEIVRGRLRS